MVVRHIHFHNASGKAGHLVLFAQLPHVFCEDGGAMQTPAWIVRSVASGADEQVEIDDTPYAWLDTLKGGNLAPGCIVSGGSSFPVTLGRRVGTGRRSTVVPGSSYKTRPRSQPRSSSLLAVDDAADVDQFQITASSVPPWQELIGMAIKGDDGRAVPTMVMKATPSFTYGIRPLASYHIAFLPGRGIARGQILDLRTIRTKTLVDFGRADATALADVTFSADGTFQVRFATPPPDLDSMLGMGPGALERAKRGRWHGTLTFPATAPTTAVIQGVGLVLDALGSKYQWSVGTAKTADGGVAAKVYYWLKEADDAAVGGSEQQDDAAYRADWRAAVEAGKKAQQQQLQQHVMEDIGEGGQLLDLGCFPGTPYGSFARLPVATR